MIDFHSHVLPGMDDGSRDARESERMLSMLKEQGVKTVVATPHYSASHESPEDFLVRRKKALEKLEDFLSDEKIRVLSGAEVSYYPGISKLEDLEKLTVEGTSLLLLEMPFTRWTEYTVNELVEIAGFSDVQLVLAHIERYLPLQSKAVWQRLYDSGILMQVNAGFFIRPFTRNRGIRYLKEGKIHFLGSDCHNTTSRPPNLHKAYRFIAKKLGEEFLMQMNRYGKSLLFENN